LKYHRRLINHKEAIDTRPQPKVNGVKLAAYIGIFKAYLCVGVLLKASIQNGIGDLQNNTRQLLSLRKEQTILPEQFENGIFF